MVGPAGFEAIARLELEAAGKVNASSRVTVGVLAESVPADPEGLEDGALEHVPAAPVGFLEAGRGAEPGKAGLTAPEDHGDASPRSGLLEEAPPGGRVAVHL